MSFDNLQADPEVQRLVLLSKLEENIHKITNICWDKCVDHADSYLTRSQESCLQYCTDRYTDTTVLLTQRFNQRLGGGAGH